MNIGIKSLAVPAAVAILVAACGGGGGNSADPPATTGTSQTTIVRGMISGFGSVIVNGVHYESDSARVSLEGKPGTVTELKVGQIVTIQAEKDAQSHEHATTIDEGRLIQGAVQAVDLAAGTLTVEGQVIVVDNDTSFDESIPGRSLAGIAVGNRVEIHGFASTSGAAHATRIEMADAGDNEIEVTGPLSALDTTARRFTIGTRVVDYTTATLENFGAAGPANGDIVEAQGTTLLADGALKATKVQKEDGQFNGRNGDEGELEGLVTRFVSATNLDIAGQPVTTSASTVFVGGTAADLTLDVMVEVEGVLDANGTLVASKVVLKGEPSVRLKGLVDAVDSTAGTLRVLGLTVVVDANTRTEDQQTDDHFFNLADVRVGDWVEVGGYPDPSGTGKLIATKLERDDPEGETELRGPADQLTAPTFKILGVTVETTPDTRFEDGGSAISATDFFTRAVGKVVDVEGNWSAPSLIASRAEIDHEEANSDHHGQ